MKSLPYVTKRASRLAAERFSWRGGVVRTLLLLVVITSGSAGAYAQDATATPVPTPTPTEEERQLLEEKRLTELRRDIELAKKAIRDAQPAEAEPAAPPAPTATPLAGDTTLENVKLEPEMVSYKAMADAALDISKEIKTKRPGAQNIAIYDSQVVRDWRLYKALNRLFRGRSMTSLAVTAASCVQSPVSSLARNLSAPPPPPTITAAVAAPPTASSSPRVHSKPRSLPARACSSLS